MPRNQEKLSDTLWWRVAEREENLMDLARLAGLDDRSNYQKLWRWFNGSTDTLDYNVGRAIETALDELG